jgi:hypothetical protein
MFSVLAGDLLALCPDDEGASSQDTRGGKNFPWAAGSQNGRFDSNAQSGRELRHGISIATATETAVRASTALLRFDPDGSGEYSLNTVCNGSRWSL